jgi:Eukaryotic and archaeal DNA primase, large subunit
VVGRAFTIFSFRSLFAGCPFKTLDMSTLKGHMARMKINNQAIDSIAESVRNKEYQLACRKHFEARYPGADSNNVGNHPNAYAEAANNFLKKQAAAEGGGAGAGAGAGGAGAVPAAADAGSSSSSSAAPANAGAGAGSSNAMDVAAR